MTKLFVWIKKHLLTAILLGIIAVLLLNQSNFFAPNNFSMQKSYDSYGGVSSPSLGAVMPRSYVSDVSESMPAPESPYPPQDTLNRMVVKDTSVSLLVKSVEDSLEKIEQIADSEGGFMVNSSLSMPEGAGSGYISLRVPTAKRTEVLKAIKALGVKTVSESVTGRDVTDEYMDVGARLTTLENTKAKFEGILAAADKVQDILQVQREIISLQSQIDSLKGRQQYLEKTSSLTMITVSLSTDELALPYAPDQAWRPALVFKQAVRSLIGTLRSVGNLIIWLGVYSVVWLPALILFLVLRNRKKKPTVA